MSAVESMACMSCGTTKAWPDAFPDRTMATCWQCAWNDHLRAEHPRIVRKVRRKVKQRARRRAERNYMDAAIGDELAILKGEGADQ